MILEVKKYKNKEIADWFGITKESFSRSRDKKLQELSLYCDWVDLGRQGIKITAVRVPEYLGKAKKIVEDTFVEAWGESPNTLKAASKYIWNKHKNFLDVGEKTVYSYTCEVKREWYGIPKKRYGSKGYCQWVYVVVDKANGKYRFLTEEEDNIRRDMLKIFYKDADERILEVAALKESYNLGEITREEYIALSDKILGFVPNGDWEAFNAAFMARIGEQCEFALQLVDTINFADVGVNSPR